MRLKNDIEIGVDICSICDTIFPYGTLKAITDNDFDLICEKCKGERVEDEKWTYLGDGVYAGFDGYGVMLHANDHKNPTDKIYLEPEVFVALNNFVRDLTKLSSP